MGGDTWVILGEWGRGYRGISGRQYIGTTWGSWGRATGALMGGDTLVLLGGVGAGPQGH